MSLAGTTDALTALPRGIKRIPKPDGSTAWYWAASQVSKYSNGFYPRTIALWRGAGHPSALQLEEIRRRAIEITLDLEEWVLDPSRKLRGKRGQVYFVRSGEAVKIGFTKDVDKRIAGLQNAFPHKLELLLALRGSQITERQLHHKFRALRLTGEWFRFEGALVAYIEQSRGRT